MPTSLRRYMCRAIAAEGKKKKLDFHARAEGGFWRRTGTDVEPVGVIRRELLVGARFYEVDPCRDLELARALEVGRVGGDE